MKPRRQKLATAQARARYDLYEEVISNLRFMHLNHDGRHRQLWRIVHFELVVLPSMEIMAHYAAEDADE